MVRTSSTVGSLLEVHLSFVFSCISFTTTGYKSVDIGYGGKPRSVSRSTFADWDEGGSSWHVEVVLVTR